MRGGFSPGSGGMAMNELSTVPLTPLVSKTDRACVAVEELTKCAQLIDVGYLKLGQVLTEVKELELYKAYSEHTQTMSAFLREIDIGIGMSQSDHYIRIWKIFGEYMDGRHIAFRRLLMITPLCKDEKDIGPMLDMAETLPLKALTDEIRERSGKVATDACEHPREAWQEHFRCSICNQWLNGKETK
jgi:hypothetical protein